MRPTPSRSAPYHGRLVAGLAIAFAALFVALGISPYDRSTWILENLLTLVAAALLIFTYARFRLSRASYVLVFAFLCLHEIGAHYTYAEVPYDAWSREWLGFSVQQQLGWERNHYDRFVHFSYGLLLAYPLREMFLRVADVHGFWGYFLPLDFTLSTSAIYELIEWGAAATLGEGGMDFLGTQGDVWDAHRDMALAGAGALIAMLGIAAFNAATERDFSREWNESLRVKQPDPDPPS